MLFRSSKEELKQIDDDCEIKFKKMLERKEIERDKEKYNIFVNDINIYNKIINEPNFSEDYIPKLFEAKYYIIKYLYKNNYFDNAVIIHDSVFFHKRINFERLIGTKVLPLWHFKADKENVNNTLLISNKLDVHQSDKRVAINFIGYNSFYNINQGILIHQLGTISPVMVTNKKTLIQNDWLRMNYSTEMLFNDFAVRCSLYYKDCFIDTSSIVMSNNKKTLNDLNFYNKD